MPNKLGREGEEFLATGFRDVDAAAIEKMAQCLQYMDNLPSFQQYKAATVEAMHLGPGSTVADLGCGLGFDVDRLGRLVAPGGRAIGVDASSALIHKAQDRTQNHGLVEFIKADIHSLPFDDGFLDGCRVDRTLQHVEKPADVIREMFRTVRAGGFVVCAEPDWGTFTIADDNYDIVREIVTAWNNAIRNPWIGRQVSRLLRSNGFVDIRIQGVAMMLPDFDTSNRVLDIVQTVQRLAETSGGNTPSAWLSDAPERDRENPIWCSVTLFVTSARKPT